MQAETTLARPYARACFQLAERQAAQEQFGRELGLAAQAARDPRLQSLVGSPRVDAEQLLAVFAAVFGGELDTRLANFLKVLMHYHRLELLPEIHVQFERFRRASERRIKVKVTSAVALDDDQQHKLGERLRHKFDADIEMETDVDPDLLGGLVVRAGDQVIDASIRGRLHQLGRQLTR